MQKKMKMIQIKFKDNLFIRDIYIIENGLNLTNF